MKFLSLAALQVVKMGSARCSPVPMFPSPYVPRFMILVPMFPSPYVTQKCFPVPLLPKLTLHSPCVPQYLCFPYSPVPMFPSPYVPQFLCSPVHLFPSPYRCSPVLMLPQLVHQPICTPVLFHGSVFHSLCSPNMFPSAYVPKHVPQCLCSPVLMFLQLVHQSLCYPVLFHRSVFHFLCYPNMFPSPYVPSTSSPVPVFPSPYFPWPFILCLYFE